MAHASTGTGRASTERAAPSDAVAVRKIGVADIGHALARGLDDFVETPTRLVSLGIVCPIIGFVTVRATAGGGLLPLLFPLVAGLSLVDPVFALGLYEPSRRREQEREVPWINAADVFRSRATFSIVALGVALLAAFVLATSVVSFWTATSGRRSRCGPRYAPCSPTPIPWRCGA